MFNGELEDGERRRVGSWKQVCDVAVRKDFAGKEF
jgi:hypothetical protein